MVHKTERVFSEVIDFIGMTSGHLEWASTAIKNMEFINGPVKFICTLCHGAGGKWTAFI